MGFFSKKKVEPAPVEVREVVLDDGQTLAVKQSVDCLGDSCPRPQLMTKKAAKEAAPGDIIEVVIDNPSSMEAIPPMCDEISCTHLATLKADHCWQIYVRKD